jgi:RNA polymerase sigma-70 factor (ECF subfamily)
MDKEIRARIDQALGELSENHRAVLVMRELEGMSYEEMAQTMGCSKGTIMSRLFHARKNMQKRLMDLMEGRQVATANDEIEDAAASSPGQESGAVGSMTRGSRG